MADEAGPNKLLGQLIPLGHLVGSKRNWMKEVVVWDKAHTNSFGKTELKDGVPEEICDGLGPCFVVLKHRRGGEPDPVLKLRLGAGQGSAVDQDCALRRLSAGLLTDVGIDSSSAEKPSLRR